MLRESHTLRNVELRQGRQAGCRLTRCRHSRCYNVTFGLAEMPVRPRRGCVVVNWFRKHLKHGSRLALFALAIQFGLSFGHFHGIAAQAASAIATAQTQADFDYATSLASQDTTSNAEQKQRPATPDTDHAADACPI